MVEASAIDLSLARDMFPRFNRLTDQEMTDLFSNDVCGANAHMQKVFPYANLFKNAEGHIAGMESHDG